MTKAGYNIEVEACKLEELYKRKVYQLKQGDQL